LTRFAHELAPENALKSASTTFSLSRRYRGGECREVTNPYQYCLQTSVHTGWKI